MNDEIYGDVKTVTGFERGQFTGVFFCPFDSVHCNQYDRTIKVKDIVVVLHFKKEIHL